MRQFIQDRQPEDYQYLPLVFDFKRLEIWFLPYLALPVMNVSDAGLLGVFPLRTSKVAMNLPSRLRL